MLKARKGGEHASEIIPPHVRFFFFNFGRFYVRF